MMTQEKFLKKRELPNRKTIVKQKEPKTLIVWRALILLGRLVENMAIWTSWQSRFWTKFNLCNMIQLKFQSWRQISSLY